MKKKNKPKKSDIHYYKEASKNGDIEAQIELAHFYFDQIFIEENYKKAIKYFELAANQGDEDSHMNLEYLKNKCSFYNHDLLSSKTHKNKLNLMELQQYGLENPYLEIFNSIGEENRKFDIKLICNNAFKSQRVGKVFSFFQKEFEYFIFEQIKHGNVFNEIETHIKELNLDEKADIKDIAVSHIELKFNEYLKNNYLEIENKLDKELLNPSTKVYGKKCADDTTFLNKDEIDIKSGYVFHCLIPKTTQELKGDSIDTDAEIQTMLQNILHEERIKIPEVSFYYSSLTSDEIFKGQMNDVLLEKIKEGYMPIILLSIGDNEMDINKKAFLRKPKYPSSQKET